MELSLKQQRVIRDKPSRYSLIRGVKGSGKSTSAIYRSLYLKNQYCLYEEDKILMLASTDEDINYIENIYNKAEEETELDYLSLFSNKERKLHVVTLESILHKYFLEYKRKHKSKNDIIIDNDKRSRIMNDCILEIKNIYPRLRILNIAYTQFFIEEVKWMKSCNYLEATFYLQVNRIGRKCEKGQGPQRILKNSTARTAIFDLMLMYNEKLRLENLVDNEDANIYALRMAESTKVNKYSHIIIDRSNDLTKVELEFVNALFNKKSYSSMMFLIDVNMPHYKNSWMIRGKRINNKPLGEKVKSYSFKNNYESKEESQEDYKNTTNKNLDINALENFQYCDIRHNREYEFMRDYS
ncbi:MAG TPA: LexA family transcriptional regulator, partial [Candidatus Paceibacterota bacterium]